MKKKLTYNTSMRVIGIFIILSAFAIQASFAESNEEYAKKLSNPVASLISVPFQFNYDSNIGPNDKGDRYLLNIQPVIPFSMNEGWNIISRTIVPVIKQNDIQPSAGSQSGLGDIVQSLFFTPAQVTQSGWIWGAGPAFLLPTASDDLLGAEKWGLGPTAVLLKQKGSWSYGTLINHIWSVAGDRDRSDINATFLQPFLTYTTKTATTFVVNTESTYDWESNQWAVPLNATITQILKIGNQLVSVGGGVRYWAESTDSGPEGLGIRLLFTLLLPK